MILKIGFALIGYKHTYGNKNLNKSQNYKCLVCVE